MCSYCSCQKGETNIALNQCDSLSPHLVFFILRLDFQCEGAEAEANHLFPAFSAEHAECGLQREPLLFSCAGSGAKYQRLCPCRDYRDGQVALCRDCL